MRYEKPIVVRSSDSKQQIDVRLFGIDDQPIDLVGKSIKFSLYTISGTVVVNEAEGVNIQDEGDEETIGMARFIWGDTGASISSGIYVGRFSVVDGSGSVEATYPVASDIPTVSGLLIQVLS